ncbi:hypothetical protein XENORESO_003135 [Xenotaenia resolanae]|uniref:Uncharacterized protein n=1 Tax=Xenotaenia resolanae TaxID=208358 RepID=A0ABV0WTT0_9TELE
MQAISVSVSNKSRGLVFSIEEKPWCDWLTEITEKYTDFWFVHNSFIPAQGAFVALGRILCGPQLQFNNGTNLARGCTVAQLVAYSTGSRVRLPIGGLSAWSLHVLPVHA